MAIPFSMVTDWKAFFLVHSGLRRQATDCRAESTPLKCRLAILFLTTAR
jgi:hypothetical protein